jgi:hypothetical protein
MPIFFTHVLESGSDLSAVRGTMADGRNSLKWQRSIGYFRKFNGVLDGQKMTDQALMRIRLNIVRRQDEMESNPDGKA